MADLFALTELASWVQSDLDTATATLARDNATAIIENYCRTSFTAEGTATEVLRVRDGWVRLSNRPVTSITTVKAMNDDGNPGASIAGWTWDGLDRLDVSGWADIIINRAEALLDDDVDTVEVVYDYGHTTVPADVKAVAIELAGAYYNNPAGLRQETVGGYSVTYAGGNDMFGLALTKGQRDILDRYRVKSRTMRTGLTWR